MSSRKAAAKARQVRAAPPRAPKPKAAATQDCRGEARRRRQHRAFRPTRSGSPPRSSSAFAKSDDAISADAMQTLMGALCRVYAAQVENGAKYTPIAEGQVVSPTGVMVTASGLLRAANLAVFELGMWQSWTGQVTRRPNEIRIAGETSWTSLLIAADA